MYACLRYYHYLGKPCVWNFEYFSGCIYERASFLENDLSVLRKVIHWAWAMIRIKVNNMANINMQVKKTARTASMNWNLVTSFGLTTWETSECRRSWFFRGKEVPDLIKFEGILCSTFLEFLMKKRVVTKFFGIWRTNFFHIDVPRVYSCKIGMSKNLQFIQFNNI